MLKNIAIMLTSVVVLMFGYVAYELFVPVQNVNKNNEIVIPKGSTYRQVADILWNEKLIRDKKIFLLLGRVTGADRKIHSGYYSIWSSMSPLDIFRVIRKGRIIEYPIRILEGDSLHEIADEFSKAGIITVEDFMALSKDEDFLADYDIDAPSIEGYLFPDTYMIPKGVTAEEAVGSMIDKMREKFTDEIDARMSELGMSENQVLTLASIIEKEAVVDSERPLISAVYHNRLKKKMPLQADPTSIYGVKSSKEKITRTDLRRKTPYNTYRFRGLPPGPIACPGMKSIIAALYPSDVPYLYFVSADDRTHRFSSTAAEHENAVKLYRERQQDMKNSPDAG
jgi:peptidoglycan lytic transglycosylase G